MHTGQTRTGLHSTLGDVIRTTDVSLADRLKSPCVPRSGHSETVTVPSKFPRFMTHPHAPSPLVRSTCANIRSLPPPCAGRTGTNMRGVHIRIRSLRIAPAGHAGTGMRKSHPHPRLPLRRTRRDIHALHIRPPHSLRANLPSQSLKPDLLALASLVIDLCVTLLDQTLTAQLLTLPLRDV